MTGGEKRLSERLEKKLEDDYLIWYDVPVGPKQLRPDFVVVHPRRGVLILEVKDWALEIILEVDRGRFSILGDHGPTTAANPLLQARSYALEIVHVLERDASLRNASGLYAGKLVAPWGHGVILTKITRLQFMQSGMDQVIDPGKVICQDEMLESVDPMEFQERLWGMFTQTFPCHLSLPQLDRIRWHLFPEIRVNPTVNQFGLFGTGEDERTKIEVPDLLRVMDLNQELLARSMGEGHRVIHGVAGSGKTMILGYRCMKLARELEKPILVLCFNKTLAARLRHIIHSISLTDRVVVRHFHGWCGDMLSAYNVDKPKPGIGAERYAAEQVSRTIAAVDRGQIPRAQYGAIMIDEGHDFEPEWFRLVVQMVDPENNSMLILYDDAQSIYGVKERTNKKRAFSFASVGIQAKGRTTILRLNYRNTLEVLSVARIFASELLSGEAADDDGVPLVTPESAGRHGPVPELISTDSADGEARLIAARILDEVNNGHSPSDIGIVYRKEAWAKNLESHLGRRNLPFRSAIGAGKEALFDGEASVKLVSMHSSKGLEFRSIYIPGIDQMPVSGESEVNEARLLYVAMTRATERLVMTYQSNQGGFVDRIRIAVANSSKFNDPD